MKLNLHLSAGKRATLLSMNKDARLNRKLKGNTHHVFFFNKNEATNPISISDSLDFDGKSDCFKINNQRIANQWISLENSKEGRNSQYEQFRSKSNKHSLKESETRFIKNYRERLKSNDSQRRYIVDKRKSVDDKNTRVIGSSPIKYTTNQLLNSQIFSSRRI